MRRAPIPLLLIGIGNKVVMGLIAVAILLLVVACGQESSTSLVATPTSLAATPTSPPRIVGFPQYEGAPTLPEGSKFGELIVVDGCLRLRRYPDPNHPDQTPVPLLLVWPENFRLSTKGDSIQIIDGAGLIAARVGDDVRFSGHGVCSEGWCGLTDIGEIDLLQPLPEGCPGPYWIVGEEVSSVGPDEPTVVSIPGSTLFFPRQKSIKAAGVERMTALIGGELLLDGDCLRVGRMNDRYPDPAIVWPAGFAPHIEDGVVRVRNGAGRTVARVGDEIGMGGGEVSASFVSELYYPGMSERCPGKFWIAGSVRHPSKYEIIVENRRKDAVAVYIDKSRLGSKFDISLQDEIIEGCSTKRFGPRSWFAPKPTRDMHIEVYDIYHGRGGALIHGAPVLTTKVPPRFREDSSDDWYLEVVVPGDADDECH